MLKTEQRKKLRKLLFDIDPPSGNEESIEQIEEFDKKMKEYDSMLIEHQNAIERSISIQGQEHLNHIAALELKSNTLIGKLSASVEDKSKSHKQELSKQRDEFNQIIKEIRGQITIAYSKFGGATMPSLLTIEDPLYQSGANQGKPFVADGVTTVFTFYNNPLYITVGGAMMIKGDGYQIVPLGSSVYQVTFDNAPEPGQTIHSFHY
jgi:hypothetical protein